MNKRNIEKRLTSIIETVVEISGSDPAVVCDTMRPAQELGSLLSLEMSRLVEEEFGVTADRNAPDLFVSNGKALTVQEVASLISNVYSKDMPNEAQVG